MMNEDLWSVDLGRGMGVLDLGATRDEVLRRLVEAGISVDCDDDGSRWLYVDEIDAELVFDKSKPPLLREIVVEDQRLRFGSRAVIGERLHKIVELLQVPDSETLWRTDSDRERVPAQRSDASPAPADETLLDHGTLWIPLLGLGLGMVRGEIATVRLRKPDDSPRKGISPLTSAQRQLSARSDLTTFLVRTHGSAPRSKSPLQFLMGLAFAAALGLLVWRAIDYQRRWNQAPVVEGDVIDVKPGPPDPFPSEFTIVYRDLAGRPHQIVLHSADVYVVRNVGDKVEIRYLPEAPDRPMGPARYRDAAFDKYVPWGIGIMAVYCVLQIIVQAAGLALPRSRRPV